MSTTTWSEQVAPTAARLTTGTPLPRRRRTLPVGRGRGHGDGLLAVEGVEVDLGAERRLGDRDVQVGVEVVAVAPEALVGADAQVDVEVAGGPPRGPDRTPTLEPEGGGRVDAGRDVDGEGLVLAAVRPSPAQLSHGSAMISPAPPQRGHGAAVTIWPSSDWRTRRTWPAPPHSPQVVATVPGVAPVASQSSQATAVRTSTLCCAPNTASVNSRSVTASRSGPRVGPDRPPPPPPKGSARRRTRRRCRRGRPKPAKGHGARLAGATEARVAEAVVAGPLLGVRRIS